MGGTPTKSTTPQAQGPFPQSMGIWGRLFNRGYQNNPNDPMFGPMLARLGGGQAQSQPQTPITGASIAPRPPAWPGGRIPY